jgi:hypothetical protein
MQIKKIGDMKTKYNLLIIAAAFGGIFLYHSGSTNEAQEVVVNKKPVFFDRLPSNFKKARQFVNIDIDYIKLPARNEIRLVGKVNAAHLSSEILDYKWTLKDNLILKKGSITGKINLRDSNEVSIDVAIKDMHKKVNVRLEATLEDNNVRVGGVKSFSYDPLHENEINAEKLDAEDKVKTESLTKAQLLEKQLYAPRKPSTQE